MPYSAARRISKVVGTERTRDPRHRWKSNLMWLTSKTREIHFPGLTCSGSPHVGQRQGPTAERGRPSPLLCSSVTNLSRLPRILACRLQIYSHPAAAGPMMQWNTEVVCCLLLPHQSRCFVKPASPEALFIGHGCKIRPGPTRASRRWLLLSEGMAGLLAPFRERRDRAWPARVGGVAMGSLAWTSFQSTDGKTNFLS